MSLGRADMATVPVDVAIIVMDDEPWLDECLNSVQDGEVYLIPATSNMGAGRRKGFLSGTNPYIAVVDPDDIVAPGALKACAEALDANPDIAMAHTDEQKINESGKIISRPLIKEKEKAHHLCVYRREAIQPYIDDLPYYGFYADAMLKVMIRHKTKRVPMVGYFHRKYPRLKRKRDPITRERFYQLLAKEGVE